jgi:hypothetical protein
LSRLGDPVNRITIVLIVALLTSCSSSKVETEPDEAAVEETNSDGHEQAEMSENDVDLQAKIVEAP